MREEFVTKSILLQFELNGLRINSFDFPGSGTGKALHPKNITDKTKGIWCPDVVVTKGECSFVMENKAFFSSSDVSKITNIKKGKQYSNALRSLVGESVKSIFFGIGIPNVEYSEKAESKLEDSEVDFCIGVAEEGKISLLFSKKNLPFNAKSLLNDICKA